MRLLFWILMCGLLAGCGFIRSDSGATRDSLIVVIQPREVGVVTNIQTGELAEPLRTGTHLINPFIQEVIIYNIAQQEFTAAGRIQAEPTGDEAIYATSSDGQEIIMDFTILFAVDPENVNTLHLNWQSNYEVGFIRTTFREVLEETIAEYSARQIYTEDRFLMEAQAEERLSELMDEQGLDLIDLLVRDITFSEEFASEIEATFSAEFALTRQAMITPTPTP